MQRLINEIVERAKANRQRIVLPEGTEERTLKAANQILTDGVADLIILGKPAEIELVPKSGDWGTSIRLPLSTRKIILRKKNMPSCFANFVRRKA